MREFAEIDSQAASTLVCNFMICKRCGRVDQERSRLVVNSNCPACQQQAGVARLYYSVNISVLVDLVQQTYHSNAPVNPVHGPQAPNIGTILLFCALREELLNHFLQTLLLAQRVPEPIIKKLFDDNKLANQKFKLFQAVVGKNWDEAVRVASMTENCDFAEISSLMKESADIRNKFMHEAWGWGATREVATNCVNGLIPLFNLFVALHNIYVCPCLRETFVE